MSESLDNFIDCSFRFVSWLRKNFPELKDEILEVSLYDKYGEFIRDTPMYFWFSIGGISPEGLVQKSSFGESIFERIVKIANNVEGEDKQLILFSIIDSHLDCHKDSPLGEELGKATGFDLVTWHKKGLFGLPPKYKPLQKSD